jgi:hypothetical protein
MQSNIKSYNKADITKYSLFLGGTNVTHKSLQQYDPLRSGYNRIFFIQMPKFMQTIMPDKTKMVKHIFEYGCTAINGISNVNLETDQITGGYAGKSFDVGTVVKDDTTEVTLKLYDYSGSPVREFTEMWMTGISDPFTGIGHYHGALGKDGITYSQHNHTAEAIYVMTDPTGKSDGIEYACLLCNMMPKTISKDHLNYESGSHTIVQIDVPFTVVKYESAQINAIARALVDKYKILNDYLNFNSGYTLGQIAGYPGSTLEGWITDPAAAIANGGTAAL